MLSAFKRILPFFLLSFFLLDTAYSFLQYFHQPMDGDLAWNVVPHEAVWNILTDPFGWEPLTKGVTYPNPNKFFTHTLYRSYLLNVPLLLQAVVAPISSPYLASAVLKIAVHLSLMVLLIRVSMGPNCWRAPMTWLALACLLAPFFQSGQYSGHIGIIDSAITYVFFYSLPKVFLLLFALPFTDFFIHGTRKKHKTGYLLLLGLFIPVVCLSGPLNPGVILVATTTMAVAWLLGKFVLADCPRALVVLLLLANGCSLYSLYLGQFDALTIDSRLSLLELYSKLPAGIWRQFTTKLAWPVLFGALALNYAVLRWRFPRANSRKYYRWVLTFAALYILLLPLGGFRDYRAGILRYDTILPITLSLLFLYAHTSWRLLQTLGWQHGKGYLVMLLIVAGIYTNADDFQDSAYQCERASLATIAAAETDLVALSGDCPVALWYTYSDTSYSTLNGQLFYHWGITDQVKQYYHPDSPVGD